MYKRQFETSRAASSRATLCAWNLLPPWDPPGLCFGGCFPKLSAAPAAVAAAPTPPHIAASHRCTPTRFPHVNGGPISNEETLWYE